MSIGALVVDDEPIARHAIVRLLQGDADIELLGECGDGASAIAAIRNQSPDLVFLDIQMPALNGIDVVAAIGAERMPATVFVTAYEQYAVRAFETNAVDYLVKPFSRERFAQTLDRAKARLAAASNAPQLASAQMLRTLDELRQRGDYLERIPVRVDEHVVLVPVDEIVWIKANRNTVRLHVENRVYEVRETMAELESRLDPRHFARVHRSAIVNVRRVKAIHPWFNGYHVVVMDTGQELRMSRYQHQSFLKLVTTRANTGPVAP
ncbi:MAG: LytTR family transcriptional regulator DNA-binding domain-containing protein [Dokdonella sp.]